MTRLLIYYCVVLSKPDTTKLSSNTVFLTRGHTHIRDSTWLPLNEWAQCHLVEQNHIQRTLLINN